MQTRLPSHQQLQALDTLVCLPIIHLVLHSIHCQLVWFCLFFFFFFFFDDEKAVIQKQTSGRRHSR
jgi:phosphatidylglycerophosphatase A